MDGNNLGVVGKPENMARLSRIHLFEISGISIGSKIQMGPNSAYSNQTQTSAIPLHSDDWYEYVQPILS